MLRAALLAFGRNRRVSRNGFDQLTSKRGNKNFYKGKGALPTGKHTSKGGYKLIDERLPKYIVPDLAGFKLKPYIAYTAPKPA